MTGVELFTLGSTAVTLADAFAVGGALIGATGAIQSGNAARDAAEFNAQLAEREAVLSREVAAAEAEKQRRRARAVLGRQAAGFAAGGTTFEGSPLLVMSETAAESELDALAIQFAGSTAAVRARSEAAQQRLQGRNLQRGGFFEAGSTLLTGAGSFFGA